MLAWSTSRGIESGRTVQHRGWPRPSALVSPWYDTGRKHHEGAHGDAISPGEGHAPMISPDTHIQIGSLLFEGLDQIDLTGPFEVLSRIPNSTYRIYATSLAPVRDMRGLRLAADAIL